MMRNAFRDLKAVPPDQRGIVLNSSRYQGQFSPEERGSLGHAAGGAVRAAIELRAREQRGMMGAT